MDWELQERQQATILYVLLVLLSLGFLFFHEKSWVQHAGAVLQWTTGPTHRFLANVRIDSTQPPLAETALSSTISAPPPWATAPESRRAVQRLQIENTRLRDLLALKEARWSHAVAAHVIGRDPLRWFQDIVIDKGSADGITSESAVVAVANGQEGLVGRIVEVLEHTSKVLLIQDSLSAIPAQLTGTAGQDGVVEGTNSHELVLKYLDRASPIKIGDPVVTSGLGEIIPAQIPVGWVQDISLDPRQLFLQARLKAAVSSNRLSVVLVLSPEPV